MSLSAATPIDVGLQYPSMISSTSSDPLGTKSNTISWVKVPIHRDYFRNKFLSKVRLRGRRTYHKQPQAIMLIEKPLSNVAEVSNFESIHFEIDAEDIKRQVNLFGAIGVSVALIAGCAFVAFMALVYALQPSVPTGTIFPYSGSAAILLKNDNQWLFCDGSAVSRSKYSALFLVIGTTYGIGNGVDTFNLPDLRNKFLWGSSGLNNDSFVSGGSASYVLTESQLPPHNHTKGSLSTVNNGYHAHGVTDPGHNHGGLTGTALQPTFYSFNYYYDSWSTSYTASSFGGWTSHTHTISRDFTYIQVQGDGLHNHGITGSTDIVGQGESIDKMPPYQTVHYIIRI